MMKFSRLIGSVRILLAAAVFPFTTLATLVVCACLVDFQPNSPWKWEYAWTFIVGLSAIAFLSGVGALRDFGATGAFGDDPVRDFRDVFRRIFFKHVVACILFIAPHLWLSIDHSLSPFVLAISILFVIRMVFVSEHVDAAIVDRGRDENRDRFLDGIGRTRPKRSTKGVKRK